MPKPTHLTVEHQRRAGKKRVLQASFRSHNQHIAHDGFYAFSARMRGPHGLRLLDPAHIVFLRPEDLGGKEGQPLTTREQRLQYGVYLWQAVYQHAPNPPPLPTDEEFLREASRVQQQVAHGLPLDHPMDVVYVTPNSFCNAQGEAFAPRKQRKLLRTALQAAKNEVKRQQHLPFERPLRRRRPLSARSQSPIVPTRGASETHGTLQSKSGEDKATS